MQHPDDIKSRNSDVLLSNIAKNINFLLKNSRIDSQTLSTLTGLGIATINSLRRGVGNPTIATVSAIADVFGVNIGDIIDGDLTVAGNREEVISSVPLVRYDEIDGYFSGKILNSRSYLINIDNEDKESVFAVEFSNNLLSPYFDNNTIAVISKTESFCDSDIILVKIKESPICFRQIFFGERGIYFSIPFINNDRKTELFKEYTIVGVVIKSIRTLK